MTVTDLAPLRTARKALRQNVLFRRAQLKLSQSALAEQAGVSRPVISEIESGEAKATLEVLGRIAAAPDCSIAELVETRAQHGDSQADLDRRAQASDEDYVGARDYIAALDERSERYSKAGRRRAVAGEVSS